MPVDISEIGCDFYAFSAHKMLGPTGVGVLYGKRESLEEMPPFLTGGDMISEVHISGAKWNELPWKFEAGTSSIADVIAFGAAVDYLSSIGMDSVRRHEVGLTTKCLDALSEEEDVTVYGPTSPERRGGVIPFNIKNIHPHDVAAVLDGVGVAVRSGYHCAQPLHEWLGLPSTVRASFYIYNNGDDVDALVEGVRKATEVFGR
jgi:cysteine desulfurase/selenocysteine lyase